MKKLLAFGLLMAVLLGNSGAGCGSKNSDDPQPQDVKLMVGGLWEVTETFTQATGSDITLKIKQGSLGFKFYSDGKLESCSYGICEKIGRWSFIERSSDIATLTMLFDNADLKSLYGEKLEGALITNGTNHIVWAIGGMPTVGNTDYTYIKWTMQRK